MIDDDQHDEKIIAIPFGDPTYNSYTDIKQLPLHIQEEMQHFFKVYKQLENKSTVVYEVSGAHYAKEIIQSAIDQYKKTYVK